MSVIIVTITHAFLGLYKISNQLSIFWAKYFTNEYHLVSVMGSNPRECMNWSNVYFGWFSILFCFILYYLAWHSFLTHGVVDGKYAKVEVNGKCTKIQRCYCVNNRQISHNAEKNARHWRGEFFCLKILLSDVEQICLNFRCQLIVASWCRHGWFCLDVVIDHNRL